MLFVFAVITQYSLMFELPFLKGSHNLGNTTSEEYDAWITPWVKQIDAWVANPSGLVSNFADLNSVFQQVIEMLIHSVKEVITKHLGCRHPGDGMLSTTNRWGETVFRFMRMAFNRQQKTRLVYVGALVVGKRSKYKESITPDLMTRFAKAARAKLDDPKIGYAHYAHERWCALLVQNAKKDVRIASKDRCAQLLGLLKAHWLVVFREQKLTVAVLKSAAKVWRRRNPELADLMRVHVNKAQLMKQFDDWLEPSALAAC